MLKVALPKPHRASLSVAYKEQFCVRGATQSGHQEFQTESHVT